MLSAAQARDRGRYTEAEQQFQEALRLVQQSEGQDLAVASC